MGWVAPVIAWHAASIAWLAAVSSMTLKSQSRAFFAINCHSVCRLIAFRRRNAKTRAVVQMSSWRPVTKRWKWVEGKVWMQSGCGEKSGGVLHWSGMLSIFAYGRERALASFWVKAQAPEKSWSSAMLKITSASGSSMTVSKLGRRLRLLSARGRITWTIWRARKDG